uniref:protein disulfide-isomerase A2 isoform X1 n=1 Tax=Ictidomys tridecemlineatus TaxID=43179 RepID=UPI001A9D6A01|nr:protein disulfide-isomerase A2 isoform X1 [Ictidomys tridecemlineatus]
MECGGVVVMRGGPGDMRTPCLAICALRLMSCRRATSPSCWCGSFCRLSTEAWGSGSVDTLVNKCQICPRQPQEAAMCVPGTPATPCCPLCPKLGGLENLTPDLSPAMAQAWVGSKESVHSTPLLPRDLQGGAVAVQAWHSWPHPPVAPWCGHCKALAPEYSKAAALLAAESVTATLAKVDGPAEQELTEEFGVTGYPTLKFFRDGNRTHPEEYTGPREAKGIVEWLKRRVGSSATRLEDEESAQALMDAGDVVVIGFFQDLEDEDVATFLALARDALDMTFGFTDQPKLFQKFGLTKDTVVLFKKFDEGRADFPVDEELGLDLGDLSRFLITHSMLLVTEFSNQTSRRIFGARILNHLLLFVNQTLASHRELLEGFREAAPPLRGQVLFVVVDVDASNDHVLQYFGLKAEEAPTLRLVNIETTKKYAPPGGGPITSASVAAFCQMVFSGKLKVSWLAPQGGAGRAQPLLGSFPTQHQSSWPGPQPYLLSQEVPPDWDQRPVKTLVGKNFEQVAFDETKNVFVKFYAPWCSHCKEMAPAWEALAEKYRDHEDIIIAELDATANELEAFTVSGFPRLLYFPAGRDRKMMEYKGNRDLESFSKFLDSGGELPAEAPTAPFQEPLANSSVGPREEL